MENVIGVVNRYHSSVHGGGRNEWFYPAARSNTSWYSYLPGMPRDCSFSEVSM